MLAGLGAGESLCRLMKGSMGFFGFVAFDQRLASPDFTLCSRSIPGVPTPAMLACHILRQAQKSPDTGAGI